jgi:phosphoribosylanthranilate isomerase
MRTRVKICGFTRVEDAVYAAHAGVDAIGLVFYPPSPRHINIDQAVKIVHALPAFVTVVALFVDESETIIREVLRHVPIDCLQFHGNEPAPACRIYNKRYIKAVGMQNTTPIIELAAHYHDAAGVLLDTYHPAAKGGTGQQFDWSLIPEQCSLPIILAGGLDAENAQRAMHTARPYALDVSSGVESSKGIKDPLKMSAFLKAIHQGNNS